jgi:hypothetical protein
MRRKVVWIISKLQYYDKDTQMDVWEEVYRNKDHTEVLKWILMNMTFPEQHFPIKIEWEKD